MSETNLKEDNQQRNQVFTDAENHIKEACEMLQREATRLRQEQEAIDAMSNKLEHVHFSSTVKLDVGGYTFRTSVQTLTKDPNSMLAAMFSGKFDTKPAEDGAFFIDRDGTYFRFILNYLRNGELILPEGATFLKELEAEAKFYQIQGIIDELKPKTIRHFEESEILSNEEHRSTLKGWLPVQPDGNWHLLFPLCEIRRIVALKLHDTDPYSSRIRTYPEVPCFKTRDVSSECREPYSFRFGLSP